MVLPTQTCLGSLACVSIVHRFINLNVVRRASHTYNLFHNLFVVATSVATAAQDVLLLAKTCAHTDWTRFFRVLVTVVRMAACAVQDI
jgi:hypothetical protein